jgi:hypothetical protein
MPSLLLSKHRFAVPINFGMPKQFEIDGADRRLEE